MQQSGDVVSIFDRITAALDGCRVRQKYLLHHSVDMYVCTVQYTLHSQTVEDGAREVYGGRHYCGMQVTAN